MPAPQQNCGAVEASPPLPDPRFAGPLGPRSGEPWRCAPWHRSPSYDLRHAPYDHPDFTSNALSEDLFSASLMQPLGLPISVRAGHDPVAEGDGDGGKQENKMNACLRHYRLLVICACIDESLEQVNG